MFIVIELWFLLDLLYLAKLLLKLILIKRSLHRSRNYIVKFGLEIYAQIVGCTGVTRGSVASMQ